ncbi:hypothetical protein [Sulfuricurvum sp.]|uniref:hypothetical protein n=1 Tax=Sulfuricurvum sp. TaxID=2025608 RepID=UPI00260B9E4A|nr:hypothetical protein [Sulfuricurvum sp.]MDD3596916.1 hypothetical protein [Sulfuricurvum sp.]
MHIFTFKMRMAMMLVFMSISLFADNLLWLDEAKKKKCCEVKSDLSPQKEFSFKSGSLHKNEKLKDLSGSILYIRDMDGKIEEHNLSGSKITFIPQYKGNYYLFVERRSVQDGTLNVELSSHRIYNKEGNLSCAWTKEVRGKTSDSRYLSEPLPQLPFQLIMEKSIHRHHINCCLYAGDIAPFKVYYKGELLHDVPLSVEMESGWTNVIEPSDDGTVSFEIPRSTYAPDKGDKKRSEKLLVSASYDTNESGVFEGNAYSKVHYMMTIPLSFGNPPLEYESKSLAFATVIGVMLVFSLGLYYNRRRKRKTPKEIYFDEE